MGLSAERVIKRVIVACFPFTLFGCQTVFHKFDQSVVVGMEYLEVKKVLQENSIGHRYLSCEELEKELSTLKKGCTSVSSVDVIVGWANNGSYMLGMGANDVYFEIEIDVDNKILGVYTDEVYTFI